MRIEEHPILGTYEKGRTVQFTFDGNVAHVFSKDGLNLEMK